MLLMLNVRHATIAAFAALTKSLFFMILLLVVSCLLGARAFPKKDVGGPEIPNLERF